MKELFNLDVDSIGKEAWAWRGSWMRVKILEVKEDIVRNFPAPSFNGVRFNNYKVTDGKLTWWAGFSMFSFDDPRKEQELN